MQVRKDMNGDLKGQKVLKSTVHYFFTVLRLASITLILTFLFYQNMEEFFLMREPLDIVRISTALFVRVEQGEWTGILKKEMKNFENVLEKVLKQIPLDDVERR